MHTNHDPFHGPSDPSLREDLAALAAENPAQVAAMVEQALLDHPDALASLRRLVRERSPTKRASTHPLDAIIPDPNVLAWMRRNCTVYEVPKAIRYTASIGYRDHRVDVSLISGAEAVIVGGNLCDALAVSFLLAGTPPDHLEDALADLGTAIMETLGGAITKRATERSMTKAKPARGSTIEAADLSRTAVNVIRAFWGTAPPRTPEQSMPQYAERLVRMAQRDMREDVLAELLKRVPGYPLPPRP